MKPRVSTRELFQQIWDTVLRIPEGRVASYGQVAEEAGLPGRARLVGKALSALPSDSVVPWHRVINAAGRISLPRDGSGGLQAELLESEGVALSAAGRVDLRGHRWIP